jgi:hypothetical protein
MTEGGGVQRRLGACPRTPAPAPQATAQQGWRRRCEWRWLLLTNLFDILLFLGHMSGKLVIIQLSVFLSVCPHSHVAWASVPRLSQVLCFDFA